MTFVPPSGSPVIPATKPVAAAASASAPASSPLPADRVTLGSEPPAVDLREAARLLRRADASSPEVPILWRLPSDVHHPAVCLSRGRIVMSGWGDKLQGVSEAGVGQWTARTSAGGSPVMVSAAPSGVLFAAGAKKVEAFEADGNLRWSASPSRSLNVATAAGVDGNCYVSDKFELMALSSEDGHVAWTYHEPPARKDEAPTVGCDGTIFYVTAHDRLVALSPDGKEKWRFDALEKLGQPLFSSICSAPGVDAEGNAYFQTRDGKMKAMNASGHEKWTVELEAPPKPGLVPQFDGDGKLYVVSGSNVVALDPATGGTLWRQPLEGEPRHLLSKPRAGVVVFLENGRVQGFGGEGERTWAVSGLDGKGRPAFGPRGELLAGTDQALVALAPLDCYQPPMAAPTPSEGTVRAEADWVIIGGVRVPVRKATSGG